MGHLRSAARAEDDARIKEWITQAKKAHVPKVVIERALQGTKSAGAGMETCLYEGSLSGGVLLVVQALTDKKTRTNKDIKFALSKAGGQLGGSGSATWAFNLLGYLKFELDDLAAAGASDTAQLAVSTEAQEEELVECAMEAGAVDVLSSSEVARTPVVMAL